MKTNNFSVRLSVAAAVAALVACGVSCAKKHAERPQPTVPPPAPEPAATVSTNSAATSNAAPATNALAFPKPTPEPLATQTAPEITNPPPAETVINAPPPTTLVETNVPGHSTVVQMPSQPPAPPTNFYTTSIASNVHLRPLGTEEEPSVFLRFRVGYEHIHHGDNNDSYQAGATLYAYGDTLRDQAGKDAWLIPDMTAEISSQDIAKPDNTPHPGSGAGVQFRADFTWPWMHWTTLAFARPDSACPFCQPMSLELGPTVNVGFDHLYDESDYRLARYAGVRLTFNRSGFVEYTAGATDGLEGTRQQVTAEIPFYESRDGDVRYFLRGLWNHGSSDKPDVYEGGIFLEMTFSALASPDKWGDLVPFAQ